MPCGLPNPETSMSGRKKPTRHSQSRSVAITSFFSKRIRLGKVKYLLDTSSDHEQQMSTSQSDGKFIGTYKVIIVMQAF